MTSEALPAATDPGLAPADPRPVKSRSRLFDLEVAWSLPSICGRSLYPIAALALLAGTLWWGPWVSLALTFAWWRAVTWFG